jgi:tetratricopeptide (TPR) repeat protein
MATVAEVFALAFDHHQSGHLDQAERLYRQILQADPGNADAHHLLGVLTYQTGRYDQAEASISYALALNPRAAAYHSNLGVVQEALGNKEAALASYERAIELQPDYAEAHSNVAAILFGQDKLEGAADHYRQAVVIRPNWPEAHTSLGNALLGLDRLDEAVAHYQTALRQKPNFPEACNGLGNALMGQGKYEEAVALYRQAVRISPDYPEAHNGLGNAFERQGKPDEAIESCRQALRLRPDFAEAHYHLGNARERQEEVDEAIRCYRQALQLKSNFPDAWNNLGWALARKNELNEGIRCIEEALRLKPGLAVAHWNRAVLWLLSGDFARGWPEYEWRWRRPDLAERPFQQPRWDGASLMGRSILLYAEQGLGDTLQLIRYAPLVKQLGGKVIVECQPPLVRILAGAPGIDQLLAQGSRLPPFDFQAPLFSLPGILHTTLETVPATVPYLCADSALAAHWQRELEPLRGFKIGIAWQGMPTFRYDRQRSIPVAKFACLAQLPGVQLISLQKGPGAEQLQELAGRFSVLDLGSRLDEASGAFMDTAAVMNVLDLVICSDSAVAHLAGALGVPVWVALPLVPDWRWLLEREDSPWYPTMRLFRQTRDGNWEDVFGRMAMAIERLREINKDQ